MLGLFKHKNFEKHTQILSIFSENTTLQEKIVFFNAANPKFISHAISNGFKYFPLASLQLTLVDFKMSVIPCFSHQKLTFKGGVEFTTQL